MITVTWHGLSCFGIEHADQQVLIDPLLSGNVVPMHYNTFQPIAADPHVFADLVRALGGEALVLAVGETLSLPAAR